MTRFPFPMSSAVVLAIGMSAGVFHQPGLVAETTCGEYGTAVTFAHSPSEAARQALELEKLVFVLHVSGNFEVSEYT